MQAAHVNTKPVKSKLDFMKAKTLAFLRNSPESVSVGRVFGTVRNGVRKMLSRKGRHVQLFKNAV